MANIFAEQNFLTMSRSKNTMKVPHKTSLPFGKLVPIGGTPLDVLPGSTIKLDLSNITRMLTPVSPIMDDISMDVYSFYCPWRILYNKTKQFFGENDSVAWTLVTTEELPHLVFLGVTYSEGDIDGIWTDVAADFESDNYLYLFSTADPVTGKRTLLKSVFEGSLFDYFALPFVYPTMALASQMAAKFANDTLAIDFQAMPFRAVQMIYNEFFRNENVTDPILDVFYDEVDQNINVSEIIYMYKNKDDSTNFTYKFWFLPSVARWKDLFTSLNPAPQRGPAVALPLSNNVKLALGEYYTIGDGSKPIKVGLKQGDAIGGATGQWYDLQSYRYGTSDPSGYGDYHGSLRLATDGDTYTDSTKVVNSTNLYADLSQATMATVNQIRYAFATQRYYEKLARSGARYHEYLKVMFGVRPADSTLQRPQFLGGHHEHINVQQVLQTSETSSTPLGSTGAYSVTGFHTHCFTNSFNEFGIILNFACIRKQHTYCQGMDKYWTKRDIFDIYNPTFAHIGEVPVMKNEVFWQPGNTDVLGYNEAWYEYRSTSAKVTGLLNPLAPNNLSTFVLTDVFDTAPTLSDNFIFEDPNGLDRALVAGASYTNQFIADFLFNYTISAVMPVHSTPGLIDHY